MGGVLVLAAGVPAAVNANDYSAVTFGYLIMRVGLVAQWLRVALVHPASRQTGLRYASGIALVQVGWVIRLLLAQAGLLPEEWLTPVFIVLVVLELAVPPWAERRLSTSWHPHHIAERYGLFVIILLGESVLAASTGVAAALESSGVSGALVTVAVSGLVLLFSLWWLYFLEPAGEGLARRRDLSFLWGYGHYGIFAALAAVGAGLEVAVERTGGHLHVPAMLVGYAVAVPVGVFLFLLWALHAPLVHRLVIRPTVTIAATVAVLLLPLASGAIGLHLAVAAIAAVCAVTVALTVAPLGRRHP
jgi:low temperature requirement protein LtrA